MHGIIVGRLPEDCAVLLERERTGEEEVEWKLESRWEAAIGSSEWMNQR